MDIPNPISLFEMATVTFHEWLIDHNIQKLVQQNLMSPFNADQPRPLEDFELSLIHISNYDFAAMAYNAFSILTITTLAFGIFGILGFTSTVLLSLLSVSLAAIVAKSMEESEKQPNFNAPTSTPMEKPFPLHQKRLIMLNEHLPHGMELGTYADWKEAFFSLSISGLEIPLLVNTTLRLDLLWDLTWHPEKYQPLVIAE